MKLWTIKIDYEFFYSLAFNPKLLCMYRDNVHIVYTYCISNMPLRPHVYILQCLRYDISETGLETLIFGKFNGFYDFIVSD